MAELQLVVIEGPNEGREFELSGATTIGRDTSAGLVIDDPEASRRHASLSVEGDTVTIEDLGSTNGTFVNGQRLSAAQALGEGDKLRIGTTVFALRVETEEVQATRVGTALPDLDDLQVTAPRQVPDFAKEEEPTAAAEPEPEPEPPAPAEPPTPEPVAPVQPTAAHIPQPPAPTQAPPPSSGPPGGTGGPPGGTAAPPPPGPPPPPSAPPPPQPSAPPPPAPPAYAPPPAPAASPAVYAGAGAGQGGYPATVEADYPEAGIANWRPLAHWLLVIPHSIALFFIIIAGYFAFIGAWFSILFTGRYPPGIFNFIAGAFRWNNRVNGYNLLMTELYPPFSLEDEPYPIRTKLQYPENGIARWRPFFQGILAFPHFFVLCFLALAAYFAYAWAWLSILFTGKYPPAAFNFLLGVLRWGTRVYAYTLLMTEEYPPFSLD